MRIVSKFLTADLRIVRVELNGRTLVVEGMVKEFMPMTVEIHAADALEMARALAAPLRERLAARLPARLRRMVAPQSD